MTFKGLGPVKTPNLDAMAKGGMLFKQCFACPVCSPARSEALTGKYNFRVGFRWIMGQPGVECIELFLLIGQSNMKGRGEVPAA